MQTDAKTVMVEVHNYWVLNNCRAGFREYVIRIANRS